MANAQNAFAPSMSTQLPPRTEQVQPTVPDVEQEEHQAVHALTLQLLSYRMEIQRMNSF
jgi:hypothetical protein